MRMADARKIVDGMASRFSSLDMPAADIGDDYAVAGGSESAFPWLQRAYDAKEYQLFTIGFDRAIPPEFFGKPGWKALSQRPLFKDWQAAHDKLASELASAE